jgi:16S rRNA A1518/A1519 N6-dimethyltransferase RsmA/KsgA/DIM1 with predicted DNA glycosylase/AP lyase activity
MRRKKLKNCLKPFLSEDPAGIQAGLLDAGIDLGRRAETLTLDEFYSLADFLREL